MPRDEITGERPSNYSRFHREALPEWCYMTDGDWFEQRWINYEFKSVAYVETIQVPSLDNAEKLYSVWPSKRSLCKDIEAGMGIPAYFVWHNETCTQFLVQRSSIETEGRLMNRSEFINFIRTLGGRSLFPNSLADLLEFEETEYLITVRPRKFLGAENFAKIVTIIRGVGGKYVSAGKDSHFIIPKRARAKES